MSRKNSDKAGSSNFRVIEGSQSFYDSNSLRDNPDCRMIDCKVPILISSWFGIGTVIVP